MMRFVAVIISAVVLLGLVGAGWYYRPWSDYAPARIRALDDPAQYPQTYQRMDEFLPHTFIAADAPSPFPHALRPLDIQYEWQGETKTLDQYLEEAQVTGLTVLHRGEVVAQIYGHDAGAQSRFTSWSVGKSFVATLIGKALHESRIASLDDTVEQYAPEYAGTDYGATSLRHLLMMSSGMDFNEEYSADAPSDVRPLFFNAFILRRNPDEMIARIERDRTPGEDFHYISPNSHVLSAVVRNVYEGRLAEIMERELWAPLGMKNEASWLQHKPGPEGVAIGYCCLQASSEDYARLGQLYLQDGVWNGERLLPEGWVDMVSTPPTPSHEPGASRYAHRGYGLHFWIPEDYDREFYAAGVFGQYIWMDRKRDLVIAQNAGDPNWTDRNVEMTAVFRAIANSVAPMSRFDVHGASRDGENDPEAPSTEPVEMEPQP
ncbi:hypothetical protein OA2633_12515 [Oceanicaulis alexandrii HTCC2633]|uniref:serine hydrolase domain-containing protein n=1 Tax=Oceanicaulis sp. HTCC2633 TaxID=314254 RepID=UPI0000668C03|nr:serine hydrolase [Oceanicaulis sp. HTCC2633]EAP90526.1 hypothetical protein OA2633_12515 [Oceanicaulis alexandrii HTCC2633] [Oceanicaulis sp. HTCC2633]